MLKNYYKGDNLYKKLATKKRKVDSSKLVIGMSTDFYYKKLDAKTRYENYKDRGTTSDAEHIRWEKLEEK